MRALLTFTFLLLTLCSCQKSALLGPGDENHLATASQADCGFVQNVYGQRVSWKKNIPVSLNIHKNYPPEFVAVLKSAAKHWDDAAGMTLFRFTNDDGSLADKASKNSTNTVHWMNEWSDTQKSQQAVTNLYWQGNQLTEADISVDNKYFNFYTTAPTTLYDVHLESLLVHELGHVLGLKHRSTVPSVMWAVLNGASIRNSLTAADRETLKCEY